MTNIATLRVSSRDGPGGVGRGLGRQGTRLTGIRRLGRRNCRRSAKAPSKASLSEQAVAARQAGARPASGAT